MAIDINIPSQVKNYANLAAFPATGTLKTIFISEDTNKTYRWTGSAYVEISPAGASGVTIGTTAITSGTVGRVLFEGTGNVVQESGNLFWDNTNARLGVGGTPISKLQVTESITTTANEYSAITFDGTITSRATASDTIYGVRNTQNLIATAANQRIIGIDLTPNTTFFNSTTTYIGLKIGGLANSQDNGTALWCVQKSTAGNNGFAINPANNRWEMGFISSSTSTIITGPKITLHSTGILIGPSGNPDGRLQIGGIGSTSATKTFIARNLANTDLLTIWDDGAIGVNTSTNAGFRLDVNGDTRLGSGTTTGTTEVRGSNIVIFRVNDVLNNNNMGIYKNATSGYLFESSSANQLSYGYASNYWMSWRNSTKSIAIASTGSEPTPAATAIFDLQSTTKGFLPPRMTTTQKNAIASPAAGLVVYDTTLAKLCVYTTTWETITSL